MPNTFLKQKAVNFKYQYFTAQQSINKLFPPLIQNVVNQSRSSLIDHAEPSIGKRHKYSHLYSRCTAQMLLFLNTTYPHIIK